MLTKAAIELIAQQPQHPQHPQHLANFQQAKGIGQVSAIALLAELCVLPRELKAPRVSRYAGLDVRLNRAPALTSPGA